jgi:hypothetical protein
MAKIIKQLDAGSLLIISITLALFMVAIFVKGIGHDLLLESGVFLVSVKLILLSYENKVESKAIRDKLDAIEGKIK